MSRICFVLQYHHSRYVGGAELQAGLLADEFVRCGWDVHYVSAVEIATPPLKTDGMTRHGLSDNLSDWQGADSKLKQLLAEIAPDVIYTRAFDAFAASGILAAPTNAVTIWAAASRYDGKSWPYLSIGWQYQSIWHFLKRAPRHLFYNSLSRRGRQQAKIVLCQSEEQRADLAKLNIHATVLRNVHLPVDRALIQSHEGRPLVLWADSIKRLKRPEKFLELVERCANLDADFLMIGRIYDTEYTSQIDRTAKKFPNFRYGGAIPLAEVEDYFRRAHLHVKTSLPIEGFPNTYIQSWLYGVPVVALEVDPDRLIIREQLGLVANTMTKLEQHTRKLLLDPDLRRSLGRNARGFAEREFDLHENVKRLLSLIESQ